MSTRSDRRGLVLLAVLVAALGVPLLRGPGTGRAEPGKADAAPKAPWWSLRPLQQPPIPDIDLDGFESWPRTQIDRFVLAKLKDKGLRPAPEADKRTLLRRLSFDLIGLPPTPEELDAFLADQSPDAYEMAVDRLLASPHYGERQARHWMDLVHFAETHGHDQDRPRPNAWPYRDYLIRSFNADKPYDRFVQEQLAGDVLFPDDADGIVATGFLASGPWDESSLLNIMEDTSDKRVARLLDRDDMVTTTLSTFLSTTAHCARCHDHKFDPISMKDYYALQAVFAGIDKAERPYETDAQTARKRRELMKEKARLETLRNTTDPSLLTPEARAEVAAWVKEYAAKAPRWTPLEPESATSANGATLTKLPDHSLRSGGKRPETDVYTVVAQTELQGITGIRLEVLTDDTLPHRGPGRQDNGNLHLNEFTMRAGPKNAPAEAKRVRLQNPTADFNQDGWPIALAIDNRKETAWGIYPKVGQAHRAVFELTEPIAGEGATELTFVLEQTHGGGHLIGRLRLSVTAAPRPLSASADALPENVEAALAVAAESRTDRQEAELALYVRGQRLDRDLAALPAPRMVYAAANDFKPEGNFRPAKAPRPIHVLKRGDVNQPLAEAAPGALSCIPGLEPRFRLADPTSEGARRAALARWVADPRNVLTWRSIVNRVWQHHFGRGIVDTPSDFGRMGSLPTHPELLDYLATTFRDDGGSLKRLHRLIVTSAIYRQASRHNVKAAAIDADNKYLWRMNRTRLDAESVRDAVLLAADRLDRTMGGASVKQFIEKPGVHVTPSVDYESFDSDRPEAQRRSVYRFVFRTVPDPFFDALDCPDGSQLTPARNESVSALQALALLNNRFMVRMSEHLAGRATAGPDLRARVQAAYRFTLGREPTLAEREAVTAYAARHGLANACRVLLNCNEFAFVD
jgi:hypothetical protein